MLLMTDELQEYYSHLFGGKVRIQPPGSAGCVDPLDQYGWIGFEKDKIRRKMLITDLIWSGGFDGIDDIVRGARDEWHNRASSLWQGPHVETMFQYGYDPLIYDLTSFDTEMVDAVHRWQKYLGLL